MSDQTRALDQPLISIVDDDPSLCAAVAGLLRTVGYQSRSFLSAEAFLAWEGAGGCACVITDIHLPGLSGIDLKQLLVARQSAVPVIMITARSDDGLEERALSSGAVCLLKKPFAADMLFDYLDKVLHS